MSFKSQQRESRQEHVITFDRITVWEQDLASPDVGHGCCYVLEMQSLDDAPFRASQTRLHV